MDAESPEHPQFAIDFRFQILRMDDVAALYHGVHAKMDLFELSHTSVHLPRQSLVVFLFELKQKFTELN